MVAATITYTLHMSYFTKEVKEQEIQLVKKNSHVFYKKLKSPSILCFRKLRDWPNSIMHINEKNSSHNMPQVKEERSVYFSCGLQ
jgi:hypothetical protein